MKRAFFTGLALLLPLILTLAIARFIIRILTKPLVGVISHSLSSLAIQPDLLFFLSQLIALFLFLSAVFFIGFFANHLVFKRLFFALDALFQRIPLLSRVHGAVKDVVKSLMHADSPSFQQVVLVPYPSKDTLSIGLVTQKHQLKRMGKEPLVSVLVPGTPNPTIGFVLFYEPKDILYTDLPVASAFQAVISCGSKFDSFKIISNDQKDTHHHAKK